MAAAAGSVCRDPIAKGFRAFEGGVQIDGLVEIGALVIIASSTSKPTLVGRGAEIDDHVFIDHQRDIAENVRITGLAEISGWAAVATRSLTQPGTYVGRRQRC